MAAATPILHTLPVPNVGRMRMHFISPEHYAQVYRALCMVQEFLNDFFMTVDPVELWIEIQDPVTLRKSWQFMA